MVLDPRESDSGPEPSAGSATDQGLLGVDGVPASESGDLAASDVVDAGELDAGESPATRAERLGLDEKKRDEDLRVPERSWATVLGVLAASVLALSLILNWMLAPTILGRGVNPREMGAFNTAKVAAPGTTVSINLPKTPSKLLPDQIIAYEVIDNHPVPGSARTAAEALYKTLNMNLELSAPVSIYARVEGFGSNDEAQRAMQTVLARFTRDTGSTVLGPTPAKTGYTSDRGAFVTAWTNGQYMTYVKAQYQQHVPPGPMPHYLDSQAFAVANAVEVYQRTGQQGAAANAEIYQKALKGGTTGSSITTNTPSKKGK